METKRTTLLVIILRHIYTPWNIDRNNKLTAARLKATEGWKLEKILYTPVYSQQARNVETTSHQRRCNIMTLHRRDVTLYIRHVPVQLYSCFTIHHFGDRVGIHLIVFLLQCTLYSVEFLTQRRLL